MAWLLRNHPTPVHRGLPEITSNLRWPGSTVHVLGALAGLHLGPTARNLAGARAGVRAILGSLCERHNDLAMMP